MRIFIMGAGYIGLALIDHWTDKNDVFWASTTSSSKIPSLEQIAEKAFLLEGSEVQRLSDILEQCDGLVVSVAPGPEANYENTYLKTAQSVVKALQKRTRPFYLLYTSSTSVYGDHGGRRVDEESPRLTESPNGKILCQTEDTYLACSNPAVAVCILRLAGIYGPERELEKRARGMSGRQMIGKGDAPTNHVHRDEVVRAIEFCFKNQCTGIYNLAEEDHRSRKRLYDALCHQLGLPLPEWRGQSSEHGSNCLVSSQKIRELGFIFKYP